MEEAMGSLRGELIAKRNWLNRALDRRRIPSPARMFPCARFSRGVEERARGCREAPVARFSVAARCEGRDEMHAQPFLSDVKTIRARARRHVERGAVTDGYRADRDTVIRLLNEALATELV